MISHSFIHSSLEGVEMLSGLILFSYYSHSLFFTSLQHPIIFALHNSHTGGRIYDHCCEEVTTVEEVEICGRWKWICEVERRRRGHCTGLLEGSNRKDSFKDCLRELNLEFDITFLFFSYFSCDYSYLFRYARIGRMRVLNL